MAANCSLPVAAAAPSDAQLTDYDRAHLVTYLRLLDAAEASAPWTEVSRIVLGFDPAKDLEIARTAYDTHIARARWMSDQGYRALLHQAR